MTTFRPLPTLLLAALLGCAALPAEANVGRVQFTFGDVRVRGADGVERAVQRGEAVREGDTILTREGASAQLRMIDGGILAVRPGTELKLDRYAFDGREDGRESAVMSLLKGGFRTITGIIGRTNKSSYRVATPTATVGIRGTDHEPFFIPPAAPGLPQPPVPPGTYDKVNVGEAFIASPQGQVNIGPNQVGFAAPNQPPALLPALPPIFRATPPPGQGGGGQQQSQQQEQQSQGQAQQQEQQQQQQQQQQEQPPATEVAAPPPPPAAPSSTTASAPVAPPPPIEQVITGTDATGQVIDFTHLNLRALTSADVADTFIGSFRSPTVNATSSGAAADYSVDGSGNVGLFTNSSAGTIEVLGGATAREGFVASDGTIRLGRWEGGSFTTGGATNVLSPASAHWILGIAPVPGVTSVYGGRVDFAPIANTAPTDAAGNAGTLNSATLSVDFTSQTVNAGVSASVAAKTLAASASGMAIGSSRFGGSAAASCVGNGCAGTYNADLSGILAGPVANRAGLLYTFGNGSDQVQGAVAFQASSVPTIAVANSAVIALGDAAALASQAAGTLTSLGFTTQAAQAQAAASTASTAASAVNAAVSALLSATTSSGATAAKTSLDAAVSNAITVASQTIATANSLLALAGDGIVAQAQGAATQAQASADAAFAEYSAALGFESQTNASLASLNAIAPADTAGASSAVASATSTLSAAQAAYDALPASIDTTPAASAIASATSAFDAAQLTVNAIPASPVDLGAATSAVSSATASVSSATTAVGTIAGLPPLDVASATANAASASSLAATAAAQAAEAQAAFTANGAFADAIYAVPANNLTQSAAAFVAGSNALAQQAALDASAAAAAYSTALGDANIALGDATAALSTANTQLSQASALNSAYSSARTAAGAALASASSALSAAEAALAAASSGIDAFTTQKSAAAGSLASASSALGTASSQLANATSANAGIAAAQSAASGLGAAAASAVSTASGAASAAQAAATASQSAATLAAQRKAANDLAGAQAALNDALAQLATAQAQLAAATTAKGDAQAVASSAATQLAAAQAALGAASNAVTLALNAAASAQSFASTAQSQTSAAAASASGAQSNLSAAVASAATAQSDAASATAQAGAATQAHADAASAAAAATTAASAAQLSAGTAQSQADLAAAAYNDATIAIGVTGTQLAGVQSGATTVAQNYLQAQYSNPAVASSSFLHHANMPSAVTTPTAGFERVDMNEPAGFQANTTYVLNENRDLIEIRRTEYARFGWNYEGVLADANVKFQGGLAQDHYEAGDGTLYMGRWLGGSLLVTDNAAVVAPFSDPLGPRSAHWVVGLGVGPSGTISNTFGPVSNVQTRIGTVPYSLLHATTPTDAFGNTGVVDDISLTADFTGQTVNIGVSVIIPARSLALTTTVFDAPMNREGFDGAGGLVNCEGAGCAGSWTGDVGGVFVGAASGGTASGEVGSQAVIGYNFVKIVPSETLAANEDVVSGLAVLGSGITPAAGTTLSFADNGRVRGEALYPVLSFLGETYLGVARDAIGSLTNNSFSADAPFVNTKYLFDASGALVRIFDTHYVVFERGTDLPAGASGFLSVPTPIQHAQVSFGGGGSVAAEAYAYDDAGGNPVLRMGRWQGGFVNVLSLDASLGGGVSYLDRLDPVCESCGARSVHWVVRQGVPAFPAGGTFHYSLSDGSGAHLFGTAPTDNYGNVGVLDRAALTVDFARMTSSASLGLTIPSGPGGTRGASSIVARYADVPLVNGGINVSSSPEEHVGTDRLRVTCLGIGCMAGATYGGRFVGALAGVNADAAYFRYTLNTNLGDPFFEEYVQGHVAFPKGPEIVAPSADVNTGANPPGAAVMLAAYRFQEEFVQHRTQFYEAAGSQENPVNPGYENDAGGNLRFMSENRFGDDDEFMRVDGGSAANATYANGMAHGFYRQDGSLRVSGEDFNGAFADRAVVDSLHWVRGPSMYPIFASEAAVNPAGAVTQAFGTVVAYTQFGGFVTDQFGNVGSVSSTLGVNFNAQSVNTSIRATIPGGVFDAVANGLALEEGGAFWAGTNNTYKHAMSLTFNGDGSSSFGNLTGSLMGPGLNGAGIVFAFNTGFPVEQRATGSVVFGNPTYNDGAGERPFSVPELMDYRIAVVAAGMLPTGAVTRDGLAWNPATPSQLASEEDNYAVFFGANSSTRTQFVAQDTAANPAGALVKFDGRFQVAQNGCGEFGQCWNVNGAPAVFAFADSTGPGPTQTILPLAPPTARALQFGRDPLTGISWGRWGGGLMNVGDRNSPNQAGDVNGTTSVDLTANHLHYIIGPSMSGPIVLPVSGTYDYALVGATSPTAFTPGQTGPDVGTLGSASLTANFTAKTVNVAVSASTPGSGNWSASAANIPILMNTAFFAEKSLDGGGMLNVTRNGSIANTAGVVVGKFAGPTGQGAAFGYSLNQGGPVGTTVSGVAAFRRP